MKSSGKASWLLVCALTSLALIPQVVFAQVEMDGDFAAELAIGHSPELAVLQLLVTEGEGAVAEAATDLNDPELRFEDISTKYADRDEKFEFHLGLRWKPPRIGEIAETKQAQTVRLWERRVQMRRERAEVAAEARKALAGLEMAAIEQEQAKRRVEFEKKRHSIISSLVEIGERTFSDKVKSLRRVLKARLGVLETRADVVKHRDRLTALTGVREKVIPVSKPLPDTVPERDVVLKTTMMNRPDLELARQRITLADRSITAEKNRLVPWFSFVELGYNHDSAKTDWGELRFGIELPFSKWNLTRLRRAQIQKQVATQIQVSTRQSLETEIDAALAAFAEALTTAKGLNDDQDLLEAADQMLETAKADPRVAPDILIDLELAKLDQASAIAQARYEVTVAAAELCAIAGVESVSEFMK